MPLKVKALKRTFRYSGMDLPDPAPDQSEEQVVSALALGYPELVNVKIQPPVIEGSNQVFVLKVIADTRG